ncbi:type VII secretion protein EccE [Nocardia sp. NBC_00508]|uniref:type VII secretion protein EccE n=1 Tax=Nocardia sp. NBC_00508 TaxID=2975992 RepID=UPI002E80410F|nr:type VII secretion protein EccE [Nocardia sp. NBC_00508]WUD68641.1 type VII secretion protein EccE [Nocardia sp. NBC_00508]
MASTTADRATQVSAPPLHSRQFWLFRTLPLRLVLPVLLLAIVVALIAVAFDAPTYAAVAGGALIVLLGLVRRRGTCLAAFLAEEFTFRWHAFRHRSAAVNHAPFDVPLPDGGSYGMRWDGTRLITVLRIDAQPRGVTLLSPSGLNTGEMVPLPEIARCLHQFDIGLASIDVISTGSRTSDAGQVARLYEQILGPLPAVAHRTVWVVLRLDPLANAPAVDRRGGGSTGTLRSAIVATRRVANRLAARDLTVSVLSAAEITSAVHELTRGAALDRLTETQHGVEHDGIHSAVYRMAPEALGPRGLAEVWATPSLATTVTLRLRQATGTTTRPHDAGPATIAVTATVRFDSRVRPLDVHIPGLLPMSGKHRRALLQYLPVDTQGPQLPIDSYLGTPESLADLFTPITGCGQVIGADSSGQGVALPLVGQYVRRVEIIGALLIAKQVILRAIALGATVVVHTNRHDAWRSMVAYVDAPHSLSLASWSAGSQQASLHRSATVFVYDGIPPSTHHSDATVVALRSETDGAEPFDADVTLIEDPETANLVTVRTATGTATVYMVATPAEMNYLGTPIALSY